MSLGAGVSSGLFGIMVGHLCFVLSCRWDGLGGQVRAHYFEEGNVQMQTTKSFPPTALTFTVREGKRAKASSPWAHDG